jgi:hypothetical protein
MLSLRANVIIGDEILSSWMICYHLELLLLSVANVIIWSKCYHVGPNVIIWDEMLSSGMKCYHLELMLSSGTNVLTWS